MKRYNAIAALMAVATLALSFAPPPRWSKRRSYKERKRGRFHKQHWLKGIRP